MLTVGVSEEETNLLKLLDRVAQGERITIERGGVPVAVLQPVGLLGRMSAKEVISELKRVRVRHRLDGLSIRDMIGAGRGCEGNRMAC